MISIGGSLQQTKPALAVVADETGAPVSSSIAVPRAIPSEQTEVVAPVEPQSSTAQPAASPAKPAFPLPAEIPTQEGPRRLRFDRVMFPESEHPWRGQFRDLDTGNILFSIELKGGRANSSKAATSS